MRIWVRNMDKKIVHLLYKSFDVALSDLEQKILNRALADSLELRLEKERINKIRNRAARSAAVSFKPFFAERVMQQIKSAKERIEHASDFFESLVYMFRRVALVGVLVSLLILSYNLIRSENFSLSGALGFRNLTIEEAFDPFVEIAME